MDWLADARSSKDKLNNFEQASSLAPSDESNFTQGLVGAICWSVLLFFLFSTCRLVSTRLVDMYLDHASQNSKIAINIGRQLVAWYHPPRLPNVQQARKSLNNTTC